MAILLEGAPVADALLQRLATRVSQLKSAHGRVPGLAVVLVGEDPASQAYVGRKGKIAKELGLHSVQHTLPASTTQAELLALVRTLNADPTLDGILVQSPVPKHLDERAVTEALDPAKDVDCFHPYNVGRLLIGDEDGFVPCTPCGVMAILHHYKIPTAGKHAVIVGRSNIVGKPMAALLARKSPRANCTVTLCHSGTPDLGAYTRQADILVAALGKPKLITRDMVKPGAVVIDVGINRVPDATKKSGFALVGDVDFPAVQEVCSAITPVPGGVGLMTVAMLMYNTLASHCRRHGVQVGVEV